MLEIRILGPIEVRRDGRPLPLGGAKQRALVADLTLHANEVVSADRLIDDLWGDEPPDTAGHMLHVYVSRLRKILQDQGRAVLETRAPGYVLNLEPQDEFDAARFESGVRRGRDALDSRPADALATFDEALASWRGRALEEFAHEPFAQPAAARLEELRQATHEGRAEALLALGRHDEALVELEALIIRFPLRERLRELQMLALYRSGRQADALQAFQRARRTLAEELGVDPGRALVSLEDAILRQDPELEAPISEIGRRGGEPGEAIPPTRPRRRRRAAIVAAVSVGVVALIAIRVATLGETPANTPDVDRSDAGAETVVWSEVTGPAAAAFGGSGDQVILGGLAWQGRLLAVGNTAAERATGQGTRDYDAAVWIEASPNGDWRLVDDDAFVAVGNQRATDAVSLDGRLVVVGTDESPGDFDAAVWTSDDDGITWDRVDPEARGMREPSGDQEIRGVTSTGSKIVAVGSTQLGEDDDAAIWTSTDAEDWTLLTPSNLSEPDDQQMATVTTLGEVIVAAGFSQTPTGRDAAVWTSLDGSDWDRADDASLRGPGDQQINAVVAVGPGLVAVGQETVDGDQDAAVWTSTDGLDWQRVEDGAGILGGDGSQQMSAVAASARTIVAAGTEVLGHETDGAVWISADGITWFRLPPAEVSPFTDVQRQGVRELVAIGDRFVAFGREGRGGNDDADVWIGQIVS